MAKLINWHKPGSKNRAKSVESASFGVSIYFEIGIPNRMDMCFSKKDDNGTRLFRIELSRPEVINLQERIKDFLYYKGNKDEPM